MWPAEVAAWMQTHPNLQTFEYRTISDTYFDTWTSDPPVPPVPAGTEETWPPQDKFLERIVVFWLDPTAVESQDHEFWVFCGINGLPESSYMYHMGRYIVSKEHQTITCRNDIWFKDTNEWIEEQPMALDYVRRCLPWLKDYPLLQTCPQHQAEWPDGETLLAAFTEGVLEQANRPYYLGEEY